MALYVCSGPGVAVMLTVLMLRRPGWYIFLTSIVPTSPEFKWLNYVLAVLFPLFVFSAWTFVGIFVEIMMLGATIPIFLLSELR